MKFSKSKVEIVIVEIAFDFALLIYSFSKHILSGEIDKSEPVVLDVFDGQIVFRKKIDEEVLVEV